MLPTIMPPIMPVTIPANKGAPEAIAIPKHSGNATKNTTKPEGISYFKLAKILVFDMNEED